MKIETEVLENHSAKLTVEFDSDLMQNAMHKAARKIAKKIKIPGFRPGKAPYPVILRQIGDTAIREEAIEILVDDVYPKVLDEANIKPYGPGKLENISFEDAPVLEFVVPLQAEVILGDYKNIRKEYELPKISDIDVEKVLKNLQERQAILEPVEREIKEGDLVTIKITAVRSIAEENQDPILFKEQTLPLIILPDTSDEQEKIQDNGENDVEEWPFPGFSRQLIGLKPNEDKTIDYSYPDESSYEDLRGIEAQFQIKVENVKSRVLPELNDEFAVSLGEYENLSSLKEDINKSLEEQALQDYNTTFDDEILQETIDQSSIKYPAEMLEHEIDDLIKRLESRLEQQNMDLDLYLKTRNQDEQGLRDEFRPIAETRLKKTLVLLEIAKLEEIKLDQSELQSETKSTIDMLANVLPKRDARKLSNQGIYQNIMGNIMEDMLTQQAMERLRDISTGKFDEPDEKPDDVVNVEDEDSEKMMTENEVHDEEPSNIQSVLNDIEQEAKNS